MEPGNRRTSDDVYQRESARIGRTPEVGLAVSGGGIRSATFALGLLQALQRLGLFKTLDYVSTVSGGGYAGAWLYALQRRGELPAALELAGDEPRQMRFLRTYSNYLTPQLGLFSGDTWAAVSTVVRNLVITFSILSLSLVAVLFAPWAIHLTFMNWLAMATASATAATALTALAALLVFAAFATSCYNMARPLEDGSWQADERGWASSTQVQLAVVLPILVATTILGAVIPGAPAVVHGDWPVRILAPALVYAGVWALGLAAAHLFKTFDGHPEPSLEAAAEASPVKQLRTNWRAALGAWVKLTAFAIPAGAIGSFLVTATFARWLEPWLVPYPALAQLGMPLLVAGLMLAITAHIGLAGTLLSDETREWWARVAGQVLLATLLLTALILVAVYSRPFIEDAQQRLRAPTTTRFLTFLWAAVTGSGILAGRSRHTGKGGPLWLEVVAVVAPVVFVVGYLVMLAVVLHGFLMPASAPRAVLWMLILGLTAWLLSRRADLNEFSMHALYRNRLVRCYLGASNVRRNAHPFHGFDPDDDLPLASPRPDAQLRPYPIFNAAINLVGGRNLAWQQRKAASFVFTPDVCGYEYRVDEQTEREGIAAPADPVTVGVNPKVTPPLSAYAPTGEHGGSTVSVGLAMATSGAAASPNMGYHSSPTLSFLMTVFNVRLGWWLRNPRFNTSWTKARKRLSLVELVAELLGLTTAERDFVYLSDGGHFENLGVYELVRRRCPFIIASDAGQDGHITFQDLGNAIEKCRSDFGIDIEIDISAIRPSNGLSTWHCAVGTIHYEKVSPHHSPGTLLFLKASMTGDEPADVRRYASLRPEFPHESTADQFFSESQFESYRALGYHIGRDVFGAVEVRQEDPMSPTEMFRILRQRWTPPAPAPEDGIGKYSRALNAIWASVRSNEALRFLDSQIFPEWAALMATGRALPPDALPRPVDRDAGTWLPNGEYARRAGFYLCTEVLQLMEDVYIEFRLDQYHDHVDNRGWMNLFQHWSWSGMLCATWAVTASTYDPRFQRFCAERLDLRPGRVRVPKAICQRLPEGLAWATWTAEQRAAEQKAWQSPTPGFNFWEAELLAHFLDANPKSAGLSVHPIRVSVKSPRPTDIYPFEFTAGYLIVHAGDGVTRLVHIRVQNHLRKMGVAGTALRCLIDASESGWGLQKVVVEIPREHPKKRSVSVDEALPTPATARQIERWMTALASDRRRHA